MIKIEVYNTELSAQEVKLITALRSLRPYEKITITADKDGIPDHYIVDRMYKEIWK